MREERGRVERRGEKAGERRRRNRGAEGKGLGRKPRALCHGWGMPSFGLYPPAGLSFPICEMAGKRPLPARGAEGR